MSATKKKSTAARIAKVYFVAGPIILAFLYLFVMPAVAVKVGIYWLWLGIGIALIAYGTEKRDSALAGLAKGLGWVLAVLFFIIRGAVNNPAIMGA